MGERAYGYLPFEEINAVSRGSDNNSISIDNDGQSQKNHKRNTRFSKIKKLLMIDGNIVVKGAPNLIEKPVMDYSQQKDLGSYQLGSNPPKATGGNLMQKSNAKVEEEKQEHDGSVSLDQHPKKYSDSNETVLATASSSGSPPPDKSNSA